ncbi:hypothetical protein QAD02_012324 [Eretmocerus hayati]|uniref:Uncharacterized protein n=1 Tax=Eretmocerus hayati TaxID=131215 RepID=A0ACC2NZI7_9HYME|nr:hypothetical protein QAD02_012324 [Eretmocerus hayati]
MKGISVLFLFVTFGTSWCTSYRILAIFPHSLRSHKNVLEPMVKALVQRGHKVDIISSYFTNQFSNFTNIIDLPRPDTPPSMDYKTISAPNREVGWLDVINRKMCDLLGHPRIAKLIQKPPNNPPYDLILVHLLTGYQCLAAIGYYWDIPVAGIVTTALYPQMHHFIGNPLNLAISRGHLQSHESDMNFWSRLYNVIMTNYEIYKYYKYAHAQDYYIKKYLGADMPGYAELEKNIAIIFSNSHFSYHGVKPKVPALIEIGGINIVNDTSEISPALSKAMDESSHGFIYFSFGSLVTIESLPTKMLENFYTALRRAAPMTVIMKAPNPNLMPKNMPDNVITFPWLPQQKVLEHPNIKLFVTHGGALGLQEAIYNKVPMICVPFFAEQFVNCDILSNKNVSLKIDVNTAQESDYIKTFEQLLSNSKYRNSMMKLSALYKDRILQPDEAVTYWTEYIIRHGKNALKSPGVDLEWWQRELLDVYAFLLVCAITIICTIVFITKPIMRRSSQFTHHIMQILTTSHDNGKKFH